MLASTASCFNGFIRRADRNMGNQPENVDDTGLTHQMRSLMRMTCWHWPRMRMTMNLRVSMWRRIPNLLTCVLLFGKL